MRYGRVLRIVSVALLLTTYSCISFAQTEENKPTRALLTAELRGTPKRIALNQDYLIMKKEGGEQYKLPVVLLRREYRVKTLEVGTQAPPGDQSLTSYELRAADQNALLSWSICSYSALGMFRLFSNERGENYLAWVLSSTVCFTKLGEPRDGVVAMTQAIGQAVETLPGTVAVPTNELIPREYWRPKGIPGNALYTEFSVEALEVRAPDDITMKVSAPGAEKPFTLVFDGKEWREEK